MMHIPLLRELISHGLSLSMMIQATKDEFALVQTRLGKWRSGVKEQRSRGSDGWTEVPGGAGDGLR